MEGAFKRQAKGGEKEGRKAMFKGTWELGFYFDDPENKPPL